MDTMPLSPTERPESSSDDSAELATPGPRPHLLRIPHELLLQILEYVDVPDVLSVRQSCRSLHNLTRDRLLWLSLLQSQRQHLPLPFPFSRNQTKAALPLSDAELERLVISINHTDASWKHARRPLLLHSPSAPAGAKSPVDRDTSKTVLALDIFLDRWLLCVYHERLLQLWDLEPGNALSAGARNEDAKSPRMLCHTTDTLPGTDLLSSSCAAMDDADNSLVIAVTSVGGCIFLRLVLPNWNVAGNIHASFEVLQKLQMPTPMLLVRALYPEGRLAFFSYSSSFALLNWETSMHWIVDTTDLDEEEMWNGVIGAKFITHRHILCIKTHAVELLTLPCLQTNAECHAKLSSAYTSRTSTDNRVRAQVIAHTFSQTTFRGSSFSAPADLHVSGTSESRATVFFLAYDVLRGLFHYRVSLMLPPDSASDNMLPHMSVRLVAAHQMAMPISSAGSGARTPRSGFGPGARGFVSTCALGSTGRRGVWIERRRGSVRRGVVGFSASIELLEEEPELETEQQASDELLTAATGESDDEAEVDWWDSANCRTIEGSTIYEVNSYDLRDDITHCAFSEAAGRVVLGTRSGDIQFL